MERALRDYLRCGLLEHGFCRLKCDGCGHELVVARVLPDVPLRQWVLSLPHPLRILCAFRPEALTLTLDAFVRAIFAFQRRRSRKFGLVGGRCGGVTVVQRFGSACELNVHFHTLIFDGVYVDGDSTGRPEFRPLPAPTTSELAGVTRAVVRKVRRALSRAGLLDDPALRAQCVRRLPPPPHPLRTRRTHSLSLPA